MEFGGLQMFAATRVAGFVLLWWHQERICDEDKETKYVEKKAFGDELLTEENELKCDTCGQQRRHALSINFVSYILFAKKIRIIIAGAKNFFNVSRERMQKK